MSDIYMPDNIATKIERSENKLTQVLTECEISAAGQSWIKHVFDPFKDSQDAPPCVGRPDVGQRNVVVSKYVSSVTVSRPATVPAGSNWDCHIYNSQMNNVLQLCPFNRISNNLVQDVGNGTQPVGGIQIIAGPAGSVLSYPFTVANIGLPYSFYGGANETRVIGKAHEIRNTTAPLTVQGQLLHYERTMPPPEEMIVATTFCDAVVAARYGSMDCYYDDLAPSAPASLLQLPKSRQLLAKEGVYQVCTECSSTNLPGTDRAVNVIYKDDVATSTYLIRPTWNLAPASAIQAPSILTAEYPFLSPFNVNGSYLTGLSSETTLVVTGIWFVETTPATSDTRLMSLAHPSPPYDFCALKKYSEIAHSLPSGTALKNNGAGDWIANIADLASAAGLPGAGLVSTGAKLINKIQDFYNSDFGKMTLTGNAPSAAKKRPQNSVTVKTRPRPRQMIGSQPVAFKIVTPKVKNSNTRKRKPRNQRNQNSNRNVRK